ncbi:MAG TPA: hypothetical protein VGB37_14590 [Candidatus Lokiarchaeia archaeon]
MFKEKIKKDKEDYKLIKSDVGLIEDLIFGIKNMVAIEDHCINSYEMSKDDIFLYILEEIRKLRTKYLSLIVKENNSHGWCISKHLIASATSLHEVGTRFLSTNQKKEADECFSDSSQLIKLVMLLNDMGGDKNVRDQKKSSA